MSEFVKGNIGILTTGLLPSYFFDCTHRMDMPRGTQILRTDGWRTDEGRNNIVDRTLANQSSQWLFFMDSDMTFPDKVLTRLLSWNKPIVGGLYFLKKDPFEPVAYNLHVEETKNHPKGYYMYQPVVDDLITFLLAHKAYLPLPPKKGHIIVPASKANPLLPVDGIGTGCLLIRRAVLEKLPKPMFSYSEGGTEDLYFCRRAKEAGFTIHVDMGLICGHMTQVEISYGHFASWYGLAKETKE